MDPFSIAFGLAAGAGGGYFAATKLRENSFKSKSLSEKLSWAYIVDADKIDGDYAVAVLKDGGFMRCWRYRGPDTSNATSFEIEALSHKLNEALRPLGTGWLLETDAIRRGAESYASPDRCHFDTDGLRFLDDLRRHSYVSGKERYVTEYILTLTYLPPKEVYSKAESYFIEGGDTGKNAWKRILRAFQDESDALARRLSAKLDLTSLGPSGLMTHLHECLTSKTHPVQYQPDHNPYLASYLASEDFASGFVPRIGDKHVRVISFMGMPTATQSAQMHFLGSEPYEFRWHTRFMPYSREAGLKEIRKREKEWINKRRGLSMFFGGGEDDEEDDERLKELSRDSDSLAMVEECAEAREEVTSGRSSFGRYTCTLVVSEDTKERANYVAKELVGVLSEEAGIPAQIEKINATDAFFGSLPGHGSRNIRRPLISSTNMADLMPSTSIWAGEEENPSDLIPDSPPLIWTKTDGSTPFRVNLHDDDIGHGFCIGSTGGGKSVLVGSLAHQWMRYANAQVFIFDVGYSHYLMNLLADGKHYDIFSGRSDVLFQPLRHIDSISERAFAREWISGLFEVQGRPLSPEQKETVTRGLRKLAQVPPESRTMTELKIALANDRDLKGVMNEYIATGPYGELFDSSQDSFNASSFQVFEMKHIVEKGDELLMPTLHYLTHLVEESLSATRPTLIVIEEAWAALTSGPFADKLKTWLATLRKENGAVFMVAHSPQQFKDKEIRNVEMLTENMPTRFFLPNPNAKSEQARPVYRSFGLNDREVDRLAEAEKKQDYYYFNPNKGGRMFELDPSDAELAFMGTAPGMDMPETMDEALKYKKKYGPSWIPEWLRFCEAEEEASIYEESYLGDTSSTHLQVPVQNRGDGAAATLEEAPELEAGSQRN